MSIPMPLAERFAPDTFWNLTEGYHPDTFFKKGMLVMITSELEEKNESIYVWIMPAGSPHLRVQVSIDHLR